MTAHPDDTDGVPGDGTAHPPPAASVPEPGAGDRGAAAPEPDRVALALGELTRAWPERIDATPDDIEAGLAKLVLTLVEFLRQVLEHQAVRRMEGGSLSDEEIERLGLALMRLQERMEEIKSVFGLSDEELNIDLGPLGRLI